MIGDVNDPTFKIGELEWSRWCQPPCSATLGLLKSEYWQIYNVNNLWSSYMYIQLYILSYLYIYIHLLLIKYSFYTYLGITLTSWKHSTSETSLTSQLFPASWIGLLLRQPRPTNTATTRRKREGATSMLPPFNKNPNWWLKEVVFCSN